MLYYEQTKTNSNIATQQQNNVQNGRGPCGRRHMGSFL